MVMQTYQIDDGPLFQRPSEFLAKEVFRLAVEHRRDELSQLPDPPRTTLLTLYSFHERGRTQIDDYKIVLPGEPVKA